MSRKKKYTVKSKERPGRINTGDGKMTFEDKQMAEDYKEWLDVNANSHVNNVEET